MEGIRWWATAMALCLLALWVGSGQTAFNDGQYTVFMEEICIPNTKRCLSEILWEGDHFDTVRHRRTP